MFLKNADEKLQLFLSTILNIGLISILLFGKLQSVNSDILYLSTKLCIKLSLDDFTRNRR